MEKFQIAKYALMQIAALAYGVLSCGTVVKISKPFAELGYPMPAVYSGAVFYRDYGMCVFLIVIAWTTFAACFSSSLSKKSIDEGWLVGSGILLFIAFMIVGSILAIGTGAAATMPHGPIQFL